MQNDCLYRVKNHAKWAVMFDIDEFFNLKDGSIFGKPPKQHIFEDPTLKAIPSDYLGSSWDAIVKAKGMTRDQVHSISVAAYRFAPAEGDQVELWNTISSIVFWKTEKLKTEKLKLFFVFLFLTSQELRSVWRDPVIQPECPKYVMNVQKTNTVFQHFVTSYANNTQGLFISQDLGVLHHYRADGKPQLRVSNPLSQKDESMLQCPEAPKYTENIFVI